MSSSHPDSRGNALILLLAHGSESTPEGSLYVRQQADTLRKRGIFGDVQAAFLRDNPHPGDIISETDCETIYVVPFMVSEGHSIDVIIPDALELDGTHTTLETDQGVRNITLCRAVGTHPAIRQQSCDIIEILKQNHGLWTKDTAAMVLCHGTKRHAGSRKYAEQVLHDINNSGLVAHASILFLEESPRIEEWRSCVPHRYVIALPYLMTAGRHGSYDIPELLGIEPTSSDLQDCLQAGTTAGPFHLSGRMLWYTPLLGTFGVIPDIIIDRVAEQEKHVVANNNGK